jgi:hypothetical protein
MGHSRDQRSLWAGRASFFGGALRHGALLNIVSWLSLRYF